MWSWLRICIIFLSASLKLNLILLIQKMTFSGKPGSSVCLNTDLNSITVPMSVKVIIAFGAFKRNKSLKCLI